MEMENFGAGTVPNSPQRFFYNATTAGYFKPRRNRTAKCTVLPLPMYTYLEPPNQLLYMSTHVIYISKTAVSSQKGVTLTMYLGHGCPVSHLVLRPAVLFAIGIRHTPWLVTWRGLLRRIYGTEMPFFARVLPYHVGTMSSRPSNFSISRSCPMSIQRRSAPVTAKPPNLGTLT